MKLTLSPRPVALPLPLYSIKRLSRSQYEVEVPAWHLTAYFVRDAGQWILDLFDSRIADNAEAHLDSIALDWRTYSPERIGEALLEAAQLTGVNS